MVAVTTRLQNNGYIETYSAVFPKESMGAYPMEVFPVWKSGTVSER